MIDLSCAACAAPEGALHAALAAATAELPRHLPGPGYDAAGLPVLRDAIAAHLTARGVPTVAEQILVTNGSQHAWTLLLRVLAGPGDRVLTEHPTYPAALDAVRAIGARARAGADARRRLGPGHARGHAAPGGAAARLRHRRAPEPDRADDARRRP